MADCLAYGNKFARAVFEAQTTVAQAQIDHSKGGSVERVNNANRALADARCRYTEWTSGRIPDDR